MGTNYYAIKNYCEHCKRYDKEHIGKASKGWTFGFQASDKVKDYDDWFENIKSAEKIIDEYETEISVDELLKIIMDKRFEPNNQAILYPRFSYLDKYGNSFTISNFS